MSKSSVNDSLPRVHVNNTILRWQAKTSTGISLLKHTWHNEKTRYSTAGPYRVTITLELDSRKNWNKPPRGGWALVSLGSAGSLKLRPDGRLVIRRMAERRVAGKRVTAISRKRLAPGRQSQTFQITLIWTGRLCVALIDNQVWAKTLCTGTRALGSITIGPLPGKLHAVTVAAR